MSQERLREILETRDSLGTAVADVICLEIFPSANRELLADILGQFADSNPSDCAAQLWDMFYEPPPMLIIHAPKETAPVALKQLCVGIRKKVDMETLRKLAFQVGKGLVDRSYKQAPPIHWAVRTDDAFAKLVINMLVDEFHANLNALREDGRHLLHTVLTFTEYDTTDLFRHCLARGAVPYQALEDDCTNVEQRYWLMRARQLPILDEDRVEKLRCMHLHRMPELALSVVGQAVATSTVMDSVLTFRADQESKSDSPPLVMIFAGPPGHGKTELAKGLGRSIVQDPENDFLLIECAAFKDVMQLCGAQAPFQGASQGSKLNNFLCDRGRDGRPLVVVLDEFDKLDLSALEGLYMPFDKGVWEDRRQRGGATVDCSSVVFILTTNLADQEILAFVKEMGGADHLHFLPQQIPDVVKRIDDVVRQKVIGWAGSRIGPAFIRRIRSVVPFLPFSLVERTIVADSLLRHLSSKYRKPATEKRKFGNVLVHIHPRLCMAIAKDYSVDEGASSLLRAVSSKVQSQVIQAWLRNIFARQSMIWVGCTESRNDGEYVITLLEKEPAEKWSPISLEEIGFLETNVDQVEQVHHNKVGSKRPRQEENDGGEQESVEF